MPRSARRVTGAPFVGTGLFLNRPNTGVPASALEDGYNFRIRNGVLHNANIGWIPFFAWNLNSPVTLIDGFFPRDGGEHLIFGTTDDLFVYDVVTSTPLLLTPYKTNTSAGFTISKSDSVTLTADGSGNFITAGFKVGDRITVGGPTHPTRSLAPVVPWHKVIAVTATTLTVDYPFAEGVATAQAWTSRHSFQGSLSSQWDTETFINASDGNDYWIAVNAVDWVVSWDGTADQVTLHPEMNFRARTVANYSNMLIYGAVSGPGGDFLASIINSDIGKPFAAGDAGTGLSEQFQALPGEDVVMNLVPLSDFLIIYGERNIVMTQFVGDPLVFIFRNVISGVGLSSTNAIADFGDFHIMMSSDATYQFDGVTLPTINDQVWPEILRQIDPSRIRATYAHFIEEEGELVWSIPRSDDPDAGEPFAGAPVQALVEHYLESIEKEQEADGISPFSRRAWPFTTAGYYYQTNSATWENSYDSWAQMQMAWGDQFFAALYPISLVGDVDGNIWIANIGQRAGDGSILNSFVKFGRRSMGSGRDKSLLQRVYPFTQTASGGEIYVQTLMYNNAAGAIPSTSVTNMFALQGEEGKHFVSPFKRGRYYQLQFGTLDDSVFRLEGWDTDGVQGGYR